MSAAGYSGTPLPKKLGIKPGHRVLLDSAPDGFQRDLLVPLPDDVVLQRRAGRTPYDVVVAPSGSCVGSVRHQQAEVARGGGDEGLARAAEAVAGRTYELSELLVDVLGVEDVGAVFPHRVTYHPTCHSLRLLRVGDKPLRLLRKVRGIDLVELPDADQCCGFGGTFALKNADTSAAMLADKMSSILTTGAAVCTAGDSSCLMHIGGGLGRLDVGTRTLHLAEILASTDGTVEAAG